ncbi:hypothetical protein CQ059_23180 [Brucella pseudogrignonensis]|nr:hypothetical protein [Ochrobactrum sp. MYb237]PQZ39483.1 hypothetical protein CQ059_23180 [Brucella pseudogrignonensis]PRA41014.1 hypothetical protein CQ063_10855 [Brucella pseudogrignonensis]PRA69840.1 hypothetical protein CQ055_10740 [Brucella pseudogrignonensis]
MNALKKSECERIFTDQGISIIAVLKDQEAGVKDADLCCRHGISEATFYIYGLFPLCKLDVKAV